MLEETIDDKIMRSKYTFALTDLRELNKSDYKINCLLKGNFTKQWRLNFNTLMDNLKKFSYDNRRKYRVMIYKYNETCFKYEVLDNFYINEGENNV